MALPRYFTVLEKEFSEDPQSTKKKTGKRRILF